MSFFFFNQLYGQWHFMSRSDVRPKSYTQPASDRHQDNSTRADKIPKVQKDKKVKEVEAVKVEDKAVPKTKKEKKNTTEAQAVDKTQEKDKDKAGIKVESDKTSSAEQQVALASGGAEGRQPDAVDLGDPESPKNPKPQASSEAEENPQAQENLKEIEYLHLPSKSLTQLEERLHCCPNARRKFRLWKETMGMCIYCGKHINALDFVSGIESDIEHILPQALGGTSAFENLVCSCRKCNRDKRDMTAMDYVLTLNSRQQSNYLNRLRLLASSGSISEQKYFNLLRPVMLMNLDKRIP